MQTMEKQTQSIKTILEQWPSELLPPTYTGDDHQLTNIVDHTADVVTGSCFVARIGTVSDGHRFIGRAIASGATLIIGEKSKEELDTVIPSGVTYWQVPNASEMYAWLSAAWYNFPSREMVVIGVTGTDGKTTTVNFLHQILTSAGLKAGMLSTLKAMIGNEEEPLALHVTTPEAPVIQQYLRRMADAGVTHCVLETTSHGLAQHRVTAVFYDIAIITNITHEHLDYHGTHAAYVAAKQTLFEHVASSKINKEIPSTPEKTLILNADDPISMQHLADIDAPQTLFYSLDKAKTAAFTATNIQLQPWSTQFDLNMNGQQQTVSTKMFGQFNIYNILAAAAAAQQLGLSAAQLKQGIADLTQLYGRMQLIDKGQPYLVIVDFAHTPNSLEKAIQTARKTLDDSGREKGRIITVFGSAGLRDPEKRKLMAEISAKTADLTILTAEDPRTESLDEILATMATACETAGGQENETFWRIRDRGEAIHFALGKAEKDDLVLVCGKGHEQSMCFGTIEYPWDDVKATETAIEFQLAGKPMPNLGLPTFSRD